MAETLLPCPFCGAEAEIERVGTVRQSTIYQCTECSCSLETGEEWGHGKRWNTRTLAASPTAADLDKDAEEEFLVARVSQDGKTVGIDHPTEAPWEDVLLAHVSLRDRLNERLAEKDLCPFGPRPALTQAVRCIHCGGAEATHAPGPTEEVTPEMIEAGRQAMDRYDSASIRPSDPDAEDMLTAIYTAMRALAKPDEPSDLDKPA